MRAAADPETPLHLGFPAGWVAFVLIGSILGKRRGRRGEDDRGDWAGVGPGLGGAAGRRGGPGRAGAGRVASVLSSPRYSPQSYLPGIRRRNGA